MGYVSKERTKEIRDQLKKEFPNLKLSVSMKDYSQVNVHIMAGDIDFSSFIEEGRFAKKEVIEYTKKEVKKGYLQVNHYYIKEAWNGIARDTLHKIYSIANKGNFDRNANDPTADYCDMNFYFHLSIGQWHKPYVYTPKAEVVENKKEESKTEEVKQTPIELTLSEISATLQSDFSNEEKIDFIQCKIAELKRTNLKLVV